MLVLGRDHVSWGERLLGGAVTSQVVNHIACPLVVVPGRWRPRHAWPLLPVIVALDSETNPEPALRLAFDEARLRAARLIVLHAEKMSASARDVAAAQFDLGIVLANWKQDHPEVGVSTAISLATPTRSSYGGRGQRPSWWSATRIGVAGETGPGRSPAV